MINQLVTAVLLATLAPAAHPAPALPLGDNDLAETRTTRTLAPGVTLTEIVRGTDPAPADQINTTTRGPWRVDVLTIDPRRAHGHLRATYGEDLSRTETVTDLAAQAHALAAVNASFFTFTASAQYPGTPVGLGLYDGKLLSDPTTDPTEADLLIDADRNTMTVGRLHWTGSLANPRTGASLPVALVDEPPAAAGQVTEITPEFAAQTPAGPGAEVVLDRRDCVVRTAGVRGTTLKSGQTAIQATGAQAGPLLSLATGCLRETSNLTDDSGRRVSPRPGLYGVTGRYQLLKDGQNVVPTGSGSFFDRNPRTIAGTTAGGKIVLAALDGRLTTSVGTTLDETARVAQALGLRDAINLDGGGSTTMVARGALINTPSGGTQRAVGDALVWN
ncbi:phosphodiester glycosidase family protein [Actinoplanes sp. NPDC051411]|uniref:phosphodiester glycosidase family protein n=1 Tax=Actinoplanes sp. NPDC051411 TaxID=3155522 RepID=UPI003431509A